MTQLKLQIIFFMIELLVGEAIFCNRLKRRQWYELRIAGAYAICLLLSVFVPIFAYNAIYASLTYLMLYAVSTAFLFFCYKESCLTIFFCSFAAYTTQHFAYAFKELVCTASGFSEFIFSGSRTYGPWMNYGNSTVTISNVFDVLSALAFFVFTYWAFYLLFADRIKERYSLTIESKNILYLVILPFSIVMVHVIFNAVTVYYSYEHYDKVYYIITVMYSLLSCIVALSLQFSIFRGEHLESDYGIVSSLLHEKEKQYAISMETIELINLKCHDIKHLINRWSTVGGGADKQELSEIDELVQVYDLSINTGNHTLDIIFMEKSLICKQNDIQFTYLADGAALDFIRQRDLYILFGNMLDNAIEALRKENDVQKRILSLNIKRVNGMAVISAENYFSGELRFFRGLPETSKEKDGYHGYGLKSIVRIVESYDGILSVSAKHDTFRLNITFPDATKKDL